MPATATLYLGHKNLCEILRSARLSSGQPAKDIFYRFLNEGRFNWCRLLLLFVHRLQEMAHNLNRRTLAYRRRQESIQSTPDVLISLLKQALAAGHRARYVLFDPRSFAGFSNSICR